LPVHHAVYVRSAELWLRLGEPFEAMLELQKLPKRSAKHPWAQRVRQATEQASFA